ncbi:MAG: hypothetical protein RLZZ65_184 [Bacteroidota bacterium]|jgi:hypothetical protein
MIFRRIVSVFFIALLLSKLVYTLFWQVKFHLNQTFIINQYCINKNRPEMHCNGQCYLAKQFQKADAQLQSKEHEQQQHLNLGAKILNQDFFIEFNSHSNSINSLINRTSQKIVSPSSIYSLIFSNPIFHPPCMI